MSPAEILFPYKQRAGYKPVGRVETPSISSGG